MSEAEDMTKKNSLVSPSVWTTQTSASYVINRPGLIWTKVENKCTAIYCECFTVFISRNQCVHILLKKVRMFNCTPLSYHPGNLINLCVLETRSSLFWFISARGGREVLQNIPIHYNTSITSITNHQLHTGGEMSANMLGQTCLSTTGDIKTLT